MYQDFTSSHQDAVAAITDFDNATEAYPPGTTTIIFKGRQETLPVEREVAVYDGQRLQADLVGYLGLLWGLSVPQIMALARRGMDAVIKIM